MSDTTNDDERRTAARYALWFPMRIETDGDVIMSISRDVSEGGVLLVAAAQPTEGAIVDITLAIPGDEEGERVVKGRIVRVQPNDEDSDGLWRHKVAVAFDEPIAALEPLLEEIERISKVPDAP